MAYRKGALAAVMVLFNPLILGDVGFHLSIAATLGLVLYAEPFSEAFKNRISRWMPEETSVLDAELQALLDGYTFLQTDKNGWIHLSTHGEQLWMEVERK